MKTSISNDVRAEIRSLLIDTLCRRVDEDHLVEAVLLAEKHAIEISTEMARTPVAA